jgi:chromosome segregation protein
VRISSVACAGFRGIKNELRVAVPPGFLIVSGRNGTGKSSFCDVIEFALSGQLRRQEGDTERQERIDDYVWWRGDGAHPNPFVSVMVEADDGQEIEIRRTPAGLESHSSEAELAELLCEARRAPDAALLRLLQTMLIRDEEITRLSIDLSETQRFQFVRDAVGELEFSAYADPLTAVHADIKAAVERLERSYSATRDRISDLLAQVASKRARLAGEDEVVAAEALLRERVGVAGAAETLIGTARGYLVDIRQRAADFENVARMLSEYEVRRQQLESAGFRERATELADLRDAAMASVQLATEEKAKAEAAREAAASANPQHMAWAQLLEIGRTVSLRDGACPLCGSAISEGEYESHIGEALAEIERVNAQAAEAAKRHAEAVSREQMASKDLDRAEAELSKHNELAANTVALGERLNAEWQRHGVEPMTTAELRSRTEVWLSNAREVERAILYIESSGVLAEVEELEREVQSARDESDVTQAKLAHARARMEGVKAAVDAIRRIEGEIIEERLAALGPLLEELYLRLRPHIDWPEIRYHIRGDVRRFLSLKVGDELNPRFMFSSGQRRAIGIAFLLAVHLSTDWSKLRTVALDDPVQHIDDFRALHLIELLSGLRKDAWQVLCTAEDPELAQLIVRRLRGTGGDAGALLHMEYQPGEGVHSADVEVFQPVHERVMRSA